MASKDCIAREKIVFTLVLFPMKLFPNSTTKLEWKRLSCSRNVLFVVDDTAASSAHPISANFRQFPPISGKIGEHRRIEATDNKQAIVVIVKSFIATLVAIHALIYSSEKLNQESNIQQWCCIIQCYTRH